METAFDHLQHVENEKFIYYMEERLLALTKVVDELQRAKVVLRSMLYGARVGDSPDLIIKSLSVRDNALVQKAQEAIKAV